MNRDKFVKREAKRLDVTEERFLRFHDVDPCDCGERRCPGWRSRYKVTARGRGEA